MDAEPELAQHEQGPPVPHDAQGIGDPADAWLGDDSGFAFRTHNAMVAQQ
jgi:hypothetical protein